MKAMSNKKKCLLIVNPVAGRKSIQKNIPQIVRIFMDAGYLVTTAVTAAKGEAEVLTREYAASHDLIVAAGGDGTLNEVVSGLAHVGITVPVGYIPCGSTNEFATAQQLPTDILAAARSVANGGVRALDLGKFGDHIFCGSAIFGAFSWMAYTTDQELKNRLGMGAYVLDGAFDPSMLKPWHMKITIGGVPHEDEYIFGAISNAESLAGILHYPEGFVALNDGLLEVLLIRMPKNFTEWQQVLHSIYARQIDACPLINLAQASNVWVDNPDGLLWSLDGESSGAFQTAHVSVLPGALKLKG